MPEDYEPLEEWTRVPVWIDPIDGKEVYRCPHRMGYEDFRTVNKIFSYYRGYLDRFLPFEGALTDQPNNLVECFAEISSVKAILDKEDLDERNGNDGNEDGDGRWKSVLPEK